MSRAALNAQLFNQAVSLGLSPNFTGKPGKGRRTNYLQNLIASYRPPTPQAPPPPPPPPAPPQAPVDLTSGRARLQTGSKQSRRRRSSQGRAKRQLSLGLNAPGRSAEGGISF
jgi:hypothetical protein